MPSTPLIGVRISWLICARKLPFAWLAASAASLASKSSAARTCASAAAASCAMTSVSCSRRRCSLAEIAREHHEGVGVAGRIESWRRRRTTPARPHRRGRDSSIADHGSLGPLAVPARRPASASASVSRSAARHEIGDRTSDERVLGEPQEDTRCRVDRSNPPVGVEDHQGVDQRPDDVLGLRFARSRSAIVAEMRTIENVTPTRSTTLSAYRTSRYHPARRFSTEYDAPYARPRSLRSSCVGSATSSATSVSTLARWSRIMRAWAEHLSDRLAPLRRACRRRGSRIRLSGLGRDLGRRG